MGKRIGNFNLVNYRDHPSNEMYKVLNFNSQEEADLFEKLLIENNHWFEKDTELHKGETLYLFAVKNRYFDKIQRLNFEVSARFRKPMIKNKLGRYTLVTLFLIALFFAILDYIKSNYQ